MAIIKSPFLLIFRICLIILNLNKLPFEKKQNMSHNSKKRQIAFVIKKRHLRDPNLIKEDLEYWRSRPAEERIAAVERLRREYYGDLPGLSRVVRVIQRS